MTSTELPTSTVAATTVEALNEYTTHPDPHEAKVAALAAAMEADGWTGAPVLVQGVQAVTGTHRIAAARAAGIDLEVLDLADLLPDVELGSLMSRVWAALGDYNDPHAVVAALFAAVLGAEAAEEMGLDLEYDRLLVDLREWAGDATADLTDGERAVLAGGAR